MDFLLIILLVAVGIMLSLILLLIFQMKQYKKIYQVPNKSISQMSRQEVLTSLNSEQLNPTRWVEDLVEVLVWKGIVSHDEFPQAVQLRLEFKKELRKRLNEIDEHKIAMVKKKKHHYGINSHK